MVKKERKIRLKMLTTDQVRRIKLKQLKKVRFSDIFTSVHLIRSAIFFSSVIPITFTLINMQRYVKKYRVFHHILAYIYNITICSYFVEVPVLHMWFRSSFLAGICTSSTTISREKGNLQEGVHQTQGCMDGHQHQPGNRFVPKRRLCGRRGYLRGPVRRKSRAG